MVFHITSFKTLDKPIIVLNSFFYKNSEVVSFLTRNFFDSPTFTSSCFCSEFTPEAPLVLVLRELVGNCTNHSLFNVLIFRVFWVLNSSNRIGDVVLIKIWKFITYFLHLFFVIWFRYFFTITTSLRFFSQLNNIL